MESLKALVDITGMKEKCMKANGPTGLNTDREYGEG